MRPPLILESKGGPEVNRIVPAQTMCLGEIHGPIRDLWRDLQDQVVVRPILTKITYPPRSISRRCSTGPGFTRQGRDHLNGSDPYRIQILPVWREERLDP